MWGFYTANNWDGLKTGPRTYPEVQLLNIIVWGCKFVDFFFLVELKLVPTIVTFNFSISVLAACLALPTAQP